MVPAEPGAVAVSVNAAVPEADGEAMEAERPTVHVTFTPAEFRGAHESEETPVPAVAAVAVTPAGNWSATTTVVAEAVPPSLPRFRV